MPGCRHMLIPELSKTVICGYEQFVATDVMAIF